MDDETLTRLSHELLVPVPIAEWLWRRGIRSRLALQELLGDRDVSSAYGLPDMEQAVTVLADALSRGQFIRIHGDYDADGVTATAVMLRGLRAIDPSCHVDFHIPNRFDEGYGLSQEAVVSAAQSGVELLITVDCGRVLRMRRLWRPTFGSR